MYKCQGQIKVKEYGKAN